MSKIQKHPLIIQGVFLQHARSLFLHRTLRAATIVFSSAAGVRLHFADGIQAIAARSETEQPDHRQQQNEIDVSGGKAEFLDHEEGYQHHDSAQNGCNVHEHAEQDRDTTHELRQRGEIGEQGWSREAETLHHAGKHIHTRGSAEQFAVAMHDKDDTDADT